MPSVASGRFDPGIAFTLSSGPYLPFRAPSKIAPAKAAQPPTEWTMVDPAKSLQAVHQTTQGCSTPTPVTLDWVNKCRQD